MPPDIEPLIGNPDLNGYIGLAVIVIVLVVAAIVSNTTGWKG